MYIEEWEVYVSNKTMQLHMHLGGYVLILALGILVTITVWKDRQTAASLP